jgi:hypothetical protein
MNGITGGITGSGQIFGGTNASVTWNFESDSVIDATVYNFGGFVNFSADSKFSPKFRLISGISNMIPIYDTSIIIFPQVEVNVDYFIPWILAGFVTNNALL